MKLVEVPSREIDHFNVSHWLINLTPGYESQGVAWLSRASDGPVFLEIDAPITAKSHENIFYMPSKFMSRSSYFPPGYASDTGKIYRRGNYLRTGVGLERMYVRRRFSWFLSKRIAMTKSDLMVSPPPVS